MKGEKSRLNLLPRLAFLGRITLPDTAEGDPGPLTANEQPLVADEAEARRTAAELGNLHRDGAISGPDDPDARLFAAVIHTKLGKPSFMGRR